jgi:hypothetical protein
MICCEVFSALCSPSPIPLLDDFGALLVKELVAAVRAQELDFLVPKFLIVAIKFAFALRAGHPKYLRHVCFPSPQALSEKVQITEGSRTPWSVNARMPYRNQADWSWTPD